MVVGVGLKIAQLGLRGLSSGAKTLTGKGALGILGYVGVTEGIKHLVVNPALGAAGLYYSPHAPAAAAPPGGMSQQQQNFMYGQQGFQFPWQSQEAFLDRQLRVQKEMSVYAQDTLRQNSRNNFLLGTTAIAANERLGTRNLDTQLRIADISTSRQLQGLQDTNRSRIALADRELYGLQDTNRSRVKLADIGARRDMYLADRSVEAARWGSGPARIATFGALMR